MLYWRIILSVCFIISLMYKKHYLQRESLCFSVYRILMIWFWALHEIVLWNKLQTSIHLQDRVLRDSFFAVLLLKSEHTVLFIFKALLQEELWDMLRVSFWFAHLDRACCFHLTVFCHFIIINNYYLCFLKNWLQSHCIFQLIQTAFNFIEYLFFLF